MKKSADPFEVEPLPKAFYYPSQQKDLSERDRKICLSPGHKKEDSVKSPADEKFLQHTNHMKIHEIPTRENGSTEDQTSSSKFDESWPSTERALVSTPEMETDTTTRSKTPSSGGSQFPLQQLPDSTLARYIHRFRHQPPTSRHIRDRNTFVSGREGEFWWLSPSPPSSSTPKEETPPDRLLPFPHSSMSPKLRRTSPRRGGVSSTSPSTLTPLKSQGTSSPSKSSLEGLDTKTAELQRRAKTLLEKSASTLDTSSTEPQRPVNKARISSPQHRSLRDQAPQYPSIVPHGQVIHHPTRPYQPRPAPPPENDILYQWRLARKMERAQEQASKWGHIGRTLLSSSGHVNIQLGRAHREPHTPGVLPVQTQLESHSQPHTTNITESTTTSMPVSLGNVSLRDPRLEFASTLSVASHIPVTASRMVGLSTKTQTTSSMPPLITCEREASSPQTTAHQSSIASVVKSPSNDQSTQTVVAEIIRNTVTSEPPPTTIPLPFSKEQLTSADVPSHMHLSCDILPCPHQRALLNREKSEQTVPLPLSTPVVEAVIQDELNRDDTTMGTGDKPHRQSATLQEQSCVREQSGAVGTQKRGRTNLFGVQKSAASSTRSETKRHKKRESQRSKKTHAQRESHKQEPVTDALQSIIGEVVSERLFSTPQSLPSSSNSSIQPSVQYNREEVTYYPGKENVDPDSSDNEFSEDELLKMLQERAKKYREQLRQIDSILNQPAPTATG